MKFQSLAKAAALALAVGFVPAGSALAQANNEVVLKSFDGFTQLRGRLIGLDDGKYTIETVLGTIQVDALQVNCEGEACPEDLMFGATFGIHGSNTISATLMPSLLQGYADGLGADLVTEVGASPLERTLRIIHQDGREMAAIDLRSEGASDSFSALSQKAAEIAMTSRRLVEDDLGVLSAGGIPDLRGTENEHVIALDGLIAVVNKSNPIKSISLEEMALIFSGELTNWSQLGGQNATINLYARDDQSGTFQTFNSLVLSPFDIGIAANAQRFDSNVALSDSVAGDVNGIGVTAVAYQRATKALPIRQECGILSFPTTFSMKTEEYPLARRLYLYTPPDGMTAHSKQIIEFSQSAEAQPLIAEAGFVNQEIESVSINEQGSRIVNGIATDEEINLGLLRTMLTELRTAARLSTTFRFTPGSSNLTPKSQADAERFAEQLANGVYAGQDVLLVGFTDSVGQFELNRGLSARRAQVVEEQIRASVPIGALDEVQMLIQGYGELTPVGCNSSFQGRSANRRVEVWLRDRT